MDTYTGGKRKKSSKPKSKSRSRSRSRSPSKSRSNRRVTFADPNSLKGILKNTTTALPSSNELKLSTVGDITSRLQQNLNQSEDAYKLFDYKPSSSDLSKYVSNSPFSPSTYEKSLKTLYKGSDEGVENVLLKQLISKIDDTLNKLPSTEVKAIDNWNPTKLPGQLGGFGILGDALSFANNPMINLGMNFSSNANSVPANLRFQNNLDKTTYHTDVSGLNPKNREALSKQDYIVLEDTTYGINPAKSKYVLTDTPNQPKRF